MQDFIAATRQPLAELCRAHHVRRLALFGSALREDFHPTRSDVDVLVEFDHVAEDSYFDNKHELHRALELLFNRKVDLITWKSIRNPYFLREVEATHEMLYAA